MRGCLKWSGGPIRHVSCAVAIGESVTDFQLDVRLAVSDLTLRSEVSQAQRLLIMMICNMRFELSRHDARLYCSTR